MATLQPPIEQYKQRIKRLETVMQDIIDMFFGEEADNSLTPKEALIISMLREELDE